MIRPYQTRLQHELINLLIKIRKNSYAPEPTLAALRQETTLLKKAHLLDNAETIEQACYYLMVLINNHPILMNNKVKEMLEEFQINIGLTNKLTKSFTKKRK